MIFPYSYFLHAHRVLNLVLYLVRASYMSVLITRVNVH
jgi:hypothetical protein